MPLCCRATPGAVPNLKVYRNRYIMRVLHCTRSQKALLRNVHGMLKIRHSERSALVLCSDRDRPSLRQLEASESEDLKKAVLASLLLPFARTCLEDLKFAVIMIIAQCSSRQFHWHSTRSLLLVVQNCCKKWVMTDGL